MRPPGVIVVEGAPNSFLYLDGEPVRPRIEDVEIGPHELLVRKSGFLDKRVSVLVRAGETSAVDASLEVVPDDGGWILPTVIAASLGAAVVAAGGLLLATPPSVKVRAPIAPPVLGAQ